MYSESDIKIIKGDEHILKHQDKYFGTKRATPEAICSAIAQGAMLLGCKEVIIKKLGNWHVIAAESDWLTHPNLLHIGERDVFDSLNAFPEAGDNWFRSEYMAKLFSSVLITFDGATYEMLKGSNSQLKDFEKVTSKLTSHKRILGFIFRNEF